MAFDDEIRALLKTTRQISEYRLQSTAFGPFREELRTFQESAFGAFNDRRVGEELNAAFRELSESTSGFHIDRLLQAEVEAVRATHQRIINDTEGDQSNTIRANDGGQQQPRPLKRALNMAKTVFESILDILNLPRALKSLLTVTCEAIALIL